MIRITVNKKCIEDLFTVSNNTCVRGINSANALVDVEMVGDEIIFIFDDGDYDNIYDQPATWTVFQNTTNGPAITGQGVGTNKKTKDRFDDAMDII